MRECVVLEVGREVKGEYSFVLKLFSLFTRCKVFSLLVFIQSMNNEELSFCHPVGPQELFPCPSGQGGAPQLPSSFSVSITLEASSWMLEIEKLPFRS